ncbi:MAG TPA: ABC transporter permease subunit [Atribacteraceae bacterium]|nr:ABC transporter permease subunit [Atribacteraceae bacterium]
MSVLIIEIKKVKANARTYLGILILWGLGVLIGINVWHNPQLLPLRYLGFRLSGLYVPGLTLFPLALIGPIVTILIAGETIAGERIKGTLRMTLARPVSRRDVFLGKIALVVLYAVFIVFSTLLVTAILGILLFGAGDVIMPADLGNLSSGFYSLESGEALVRLLLAGTAVSIYIIAYGSIALFFSSFLNHSLASPIFTLVLTATFTVLENLEFFKPFSPYLITHHFLYWQNFMIEQINWTGFTGSLTIIALYIAACLCFGGIIFQWRDEVS